MQLRSHVYDGAPLQRLEQLRRRLEARVRLRLHERRDQLFHEGAELRVELRRGAGQALQLEMFGLAGEELLLYKLRLEGATDQQIRFAQSLQQQLEAQGALQNLEREAERIFEQTRTPDKRFETEVEKLKDLLAKERLTARGQDDKQIIERRMSEAVDELSHYLQSEYIVVNDDFDQALDELQCIVESQRLRTETQAERYQSLLMELLS